MRYSIPSHDTSHQPESTDSRSSITLDLKMRNDFLFQPPFRCEERMGERFVYAHSGRKSWIASWIGSYYVKQL